MPLYSFKCKKCNRIDDVYFSIHEPKISTCRSCKSDETFQYFGNSQVSIHGFTEFNDPRGGRGKLTMKQIKDIEKRDKLVYIEENDYQSEIKKNRKYNKQKEDQKIEKIIDQGMKTLKQKWG